jgi:hypothetical protein
MTDDRVYPLLWDIFSNVNEQLRFAEAKNGALVTIDLALGLTLVGLFDGAPVDVTVYQPVVYPLQYPRTTAAGTNYTSNMSEG